MSEWPVFGNFINTKYPNGTQFTYFPFSLILNNINNLYSFTIIIQIPMEHTSSSQPYTSIFYLSHLLALFPFSQSRGFKFIYLSLLYSLTLLVLFVALFFSHVSDIRKRESSNTNILLYVGYEVMNLALTVTCIVAPIVNYASIKSIIKGKNLVIIL